MTKKILVVGDSMLDIRLDSVVERLCPEAPLPIYDVYNTTHYAGGAANVALNIQRMGGQVTLLTPLTHDAAGTTLMDIFLSADLAVHTTPCEATTTKTRVFADRTMLARIDDDSILSYEQAELLTESFARIVDNYDTVVFSDYGKGSMRVCEPMIAHCMDKLTIVDPKGTNWNKYLGVGYIKANAAEVRAMGIRAADIVEQYRLHGLIHTNGVAGYTLHQPNRNALAWPAYSVPAVDPTGAGDSFVAAMAVALTNDLPLDRACQHGAVAGALATTHVGTAVITAEEIEECLPKYLSSITQQ